MTRIHLRASAVAVAAILALAACTASSDASPAPEDAATTPSSVAVKTESLGSQLDQIAITDSQPQEIQVALVDEVVASNRRLIEVIDTSTGARHTLVAVKPLRIGEEAANGEWFGNIDVGGDRAV